MNAATVIGPRSRITSAIRTPKSALSNPPSAIRNPQWSVLLHRDERLAVAAPDENLRDAAGRHPLQLPRRLGRVRHGPAVGPQEELVSAHRPRPPPHWIALVAGGGGRTRPPPPPPPPS